MARRPKGEESQTCRMTLRMTESERDAIDMQARMGGMSRNEFIVQRAAYNRANFKISDAHLAEIARLQFGRSDDGQGESEAHIDHRRPGEKRATRTHRFYFRANRDERDMLRRKSAEAGLSMTEYVLLNTVYRPAENMPALNRGELRAIAVELRAQGRNLNQIARTANGIASLAAREDELDASLVDELVRRLLEDNERTRALLNDALSAVSKALADTYASSSRELE